MHGYRYEQRDGNSVIIYEHKDVSSYDGISRAITHLTKATKAEAKHTLKIKRGRHMRRALRAIKQRGAIRMFGSGSEAKTKLPKRRSLRPTSFSRYGRLTTWTYTSERKAWDFDHKTMRVVATVIESKRMTMPEQRKLKGPRVEVYDPYWEW